MEKDLLEKELKIRVLEDEQERLVRSELELKKILEDKINGID